MPSAKQQPSNVKHGGAIRPNVWVLTFGPPCIFTLKYTYESSDHKSIIRLLISWFIWNIYILTLNKIIIVETNASVTLPCFNTADRLLQVKSNQIKTSHICNFCHITFTAHSAQRALCNSKRRGLPLDERSILNPAAHKTAANCCWLLLTAANCCNRSRKHGRDCSS